MSWLSEHAGGLGTLIGGGIGLMLGGPPGAAAGAMIGGAGGGLLQGDTYEDPSTRVYDPFKGYRGYFGQQLADLQAGSKEFSPNDPSYQFRYQQGMDAVNRQMAASGQLGSGLQMKSLMDYGQQSASQEYGNEWNRLASLAGVGQTMGVGSTNQGNTFMQNLGAGAGLFNAFGGMGALQGMFSGGSSAGSMVGGDIGGSLGSDYGGSFDMGMGNWSANPGALSGFQW